ncbi:AraC family transcriptional regulator [Moraxella nasicaprae]|uniref:Cupin domain-containing protein n=1 Tax=Moraxella nasicaprae TaxID=2904122 RepID=A0ABY6F317_9GAMM|nr:cupin domain-containing protein [Moraxella nasicaprae]UXZ04467.1 cupin domain-containing protein [Moraxella nasicaprae]
MDILDKLLNFAQITGGVNIKCQLHGNWQLDNTAQDAQAVAHIVTKGMAKLTHGDETWLLNEGDIALFPRTPTHCLYSHTEQPPSTNTQKFSNQGGFVINQIGDSDHDCELFCLHFHYDRHAELMYSLPEMLILHIEQSPLSTLIDLLKHEANQPSLASVSVVNALSIVFLTMMLRQYLTDKNAQVLGTLKGYQEPRLQPLINAIMQHPEQDWRIEQMSDFAHLSRSQLIRLFHQHLQATPHAFVHKIRLQKAAMLLAQSNDSVLSIALSTGFLSETHFGKAFKSYYQITPSQYRNKKPPNLD